MAHRLLLLRHLKSSWDQAGLSDHDRPLAPRGRRAGKALRRHLAAQPSAPQLVLCSTAVRTVQTWDAISGAFSTQPEVLVSDDLYLADPAAILSRLRDVPEAVNGVLVIGHNPGMEQFAVDLGTSSGDTDALARMRFKYPTGGLATFTVTAMWRDLPSGARLDDFVVPRDLP